MSRLNAADELPVPIRGVRLLGLILRVSALNLRARLQYRSDFILWFLQGVTYQVLGLTFVWAVLARFHVVRGWTTDQVLFMYGLRLLAHSLYLPLFWNITTIPQMVRQGNFDRVLLRPINALVQVLLQGFSANSMGDLLVSFTLLGIAQRALHIRWTPATICFLTLVVVGGALLEAGLQLAISALSLRFIATGQLNNWADEVVNSFANYPVTIFGTTLQYLFTFIMPIAFLSCFPSAVFLNKTWSVPFTPAFAYGAPVAGWLVFGAAYALWSYGLRFYQGTGT